LGIPEYFFPSVPTLREREIKRDRKSERDRENERERKIEREREKDD
jgi:hypothetical protein